MSNLSYPFVSVIIPVLNDFERLKKCLKALEEQTYPKKLYEVIVVDNGSDEDIEEVVAQFSQAFAACESRPSSYAARNKGVSLAKGDVIAFTDADCIPVFDWIEKGVANLLQVSNCGLVAGKIKIFFKEPEQPTAVELYESLTAFPQQQYIEELKFGVTANIFTFKSVINNVNLFDDSLKSGGDREWGERVFSFGYAQIYADDTCVAHPARYSLYELHKKVLRTTTGVYNINRKNDDYSSIQIFKDLRDLKPPIKPIFDIWADKRLSGNKQRIQFYLILLFVKYTKSLETIRLKMKTQLQR